MDEREPGDVLRSDARRHHSNGLLLSGKRRRRRLAAKARMRAVMASPSAREAAADRPDAADRPPCAASFSWIPTQTDACGNQRMLARVRAGLHPAAASLAAQSAVVQT